MIDEFLDFMPQVVTIEPLLSEDDFGTPTYGDPVEVPARVVGRQRLIRSTAGDEKVSTVVVYLGVLTGIDSKDRITLPEEFVPRQPPIMAISRTPDELGLHHETIYA